MSWDVCRFVKKPYMNAELIFPLKQAAVETAIEAARQRPDIKRLIVFGSSVRSTCNPWSDVDLYIDGADRIESPLRIHHKDQAFDLWYSSDREESPEEDLFKEIDRTGVVVYDRDATT